MSLENQSDGSVLEQGPIITADDINFIEQSGQPPLYVVGMLSGIRSTGKTLKQIYDQAISEPGNEEHIPAVKQARDFLAENSVRFRLKPSPDESV